MRKRSRMHDHRNHELYYLVGGKTKYVVGDEIFNVGEGDLVIIPRRVFHFTDSEECMHNERYLFSFDDSVFDDETSCLLDELLTRRLVHIPPNRREEFNGIVAAIEKCYGSDSPLVRAALKIHLMELVSYICLHSVDAVVKIDESDRVVHDICDYINAHYGESITLASLSRTFAFSESYVSRKFKSVTGVGVSEYVTFVRVMNAEQMLRSEVRSITDVAERCGFNDSNYFSAVFKKIKGITPLKFARLSADSD